MAIDSADNKFFMTNLSSNVLYMISNSTGLVTTVAGSLLPPSVYPTCQNGSFITTCTPSVLDNPLRVSAPTFTAAAFGNSANFWIATVPPLFSTFYVNSNGTLVYLSGNQIIAAQLYPAAASFTPSAFRLLPRYDLAGTLLGSAFYPSQPLVHPQSEAACQLACLNSAGCTAYSFAAAAVSSVAPFFSSSLAITSGSCYLFSILSSSPATL
jgi:hypothetical protein